MDSWKEMSTGKESVGNRAGVLKEGGRGSDGEVMRTLRHRYYRIQRTGMSGWIMGGDEHRKGESGGVER